MSDGTEQHRQDTVDGNSGLKSNCRVFWTYNLKALSLSMGHLDRNWAIPALFIMSGICAWCTRKKLISKLNNCLFAALSIRANSTLIWLISDMADLSELRRCLSV